MTTLAELCTSVDYGYTASASDDPAVGPKFLRITDIVPDLIDWSTVPHCEIEDGKRDKFLLDASDIVIARTGATVGYAKQIWARPEGATFASYLVRFRPDPSRVDPNYLGQVVQSTSFKKWVKSVAGGAAQPNASAKLLGTFEVPLPSPDNQRQIGAALRAITELIENNRRRIEIVEEMARLIYREWFVHFRFPGPEDVELVDSDLGPIPDGWKVRPLSAVLELAYGKALKADDRRGGDVAVYGSGGIVGWHDEALVDGPGIVVGRKGNVGAVYWSDVDFYPIDTTYFVKSEMPLSFVYHQLQTLEFIDSHAAVPGLSRDQAYSLRVVVPARGALASFDDTVSPMYELRRNLIAQNDVLTNARDLLLPRLISGELDVSDLDLDLDLEPVA